MYPGLRLALCNSAFYFLNTLVREIHFYPKSLLKEKQKQPNFMLLKNLSKISKFLKASSPPHQPSGASLSPFSRNVITICIHLYLNTALPEGKKCTVERVLFTWETHLADSHRFMTGKEP